MCFVALFSWTAIFVDCRKSFARARGGRFLRFMGGTLAAIRCRKRWLFPAFGFSCVFGVVSFMDRKVVFVFLAFALLVGGCLDLFYKGPSIPRSYPAVVLGVWMPALLVPWGPAIHSIEQPEELRDLGANTASFAVSVPYDDSGAIDGNAVEFSTGMARQWIRAYRARNVSVLLSLEPVSGFGEPGAIPPDVVSNPTFAVQYDAALQGVARMAEEENVEFLSPMNEPDYKLGLEAADLWNPRMARVVQGAFSGKRVYKGSLYDAVRDGRKPDFSGYDAV